MSIGFSAPSPSKFQGAYYTGCRPSDPAGTVQPSEVLREGIYFYIRTFGGPENRRGNYGATVASFQKPWLEVSGGLRDLLLAIAGWVARMESNQQSQRAKAGLARAMAQGKRLG